MCIPGTQKCDRCGGDALATTMSRFNTETICMRCIDLEKAHPAYKKAAEAELQAVRGGDYNFSGVGIPADLRALSIAAKEKAATLANGQSDHSDKE